MTERDQLARPVMRRAAGFHPDEAGRQRLEKRRQLRALDRARENHPAGGVDRVNLKDMLGQIETDGRDRRKIGDRLAHGRRPLLMGCSTTTIMAQLFTEPDAGAAPSTPSL